MDSAGFLLGFCREAQVDSVVDSVVDSGGILKWILEGFCRAKLVPSCFAEARAGLDRTRASYVVLFQVFWGVSG